MTRGGFTLIELMVCVALSAVLLTLAVPGYRHAVLAARRHDARMALHRLQSLQERHYFARLRYADSLAALGAAATSDERFYALRMDVPDDGQSYRLEALAVGDQADDAECRSFTLDDANARGASGGDRCWR